MASAVQETRLAIEAGLPMNALQADPEFRTILGEPEFAAALRTGLDRGKEADSNPGEIQK